MSRSTRKTKASPNGDLLQTEFYTPQKSKLTKSAVKINEAAEEKENQNSDDEKEMITIKALSTKKEKGVKERNTEAKVASSSTGAMAKRLVIKEKEKEEESKTAESDTKFTEILETKYIPREFLYRDKEKEDIFTFILNCIKKNKYDSLLISGNPGTGKTLTITHVLKKMEECGMKAFSEYLESEDELKDVECPKRIKTFQFNAMNYKNPSDIVVDLMNSLDCDSSQKVAKGSSSTRILIDKLKQELVAKNKDTLSVVFVDEIDNLFNRHSVAGEMLELLKLPKYQNSNFMLIGASNTIDLIVNLNQEYKISTEIKNIVFQPYSNDEIFSILKNRLYNTVGLEDKGKAFDETAVRFCAKKIYSLKGGDIRYVFEVIKKVYHQKVQNAPEKEVESKDPGTPETKEDEDKEEEEETKENKEVKEDPKITLSDMLKTFEELYGRNTSSVIDSMPQQQQMGLLALYLILSKKNSVVITKGDLLSSYNNIASANFLPKIDISTLEDILQTYESYDFVRLKNKKKAGVPGKSPFKTMNKMLGDEVIPVITADQIKSSFEKSDFFSRYLG